MDRHLNSLLIFGLFFCTIKLNFQPSIIDPITMMPHIQTFLPRSLQPKLHIPSQISSGVLPQCE